MGTVVVVAAAYAWARWRRRDARASEIASFAGGLGAVLLALNGPIHDLSDYYLFTAHMAQHLILTLAVPPLLLAGTPPWMIDAVIGQLFRVPGARPVLTRLTRPLPAFVCYAVALIAWHLPWPYELALEAHDWHVVEHLMLLAGSTLGWWPVLSRSRLLPAAPYAAQILYLFVFGMPMTIVAAMVTSANNVLYPYYAAAPRVFDLTPLADQRLGGILMWVPAGLVPVVAFTIVFFRWVRSEATETTSAVERPAGFTK